MTNQGIVVETVEYIAQLRLSKGTKCVKRSDLGKGDISVILPNGKITVLHQNEYRLVTNARIGHK